MNSFKKLDDILEKKIHTLNSNSREILQELLHRDEFAIDLEMLDRLKEKLQLTSLEVDILLILFAPEIYSKYEKIYAYIQDDLNRPYPTVQLLVLLLPQYEKELYQYFIRPSKLTILSLIKSTPNSDEELLFQQPLRVSPSVRNYLLGDIHIEGTLAPYSQLIKPHHIIDSDSKAIDFIQSSVDNSKRFIINIYGYSDKKRREEALNIASHFGFGLLVIDTKEALKEEELEMILPQLIRDALLSGVLLYFESFDTFLESQNRKEERLFAQLEQFAWLTLFSTETIWRPIEMPKRQIFYSIKKEGGTYRYSKVSQRLSKHAKHIISSHTINDIILPQKQKEQLQDIITHYKYQNRVFNEWGYSNFFQSRGISLLFSGASGTGKTMGASILANQLGVELYKIELSKMVSKYIGDTEKNLSTLFDLASELDVILFFDEADALFGKRTEVKESHDRYANIEVSYLLQKIEEYEGIVILASNFKENIDEAFLRRLRFIVDFPIPNAYERELIWHKVLPKSNLQSNHNIDFTLLAKRFKLSGANIRNIALYSAFLAISEEVKIGEKHIVKALKEEFDKSGDIFSDEDFKFLKSKQEG